MLTGMPADFGTFMNGEIEKWGKVIEALHTKQVE